MDTIFSTISGQFGRAIVIGAVLPASVFACALYFLVVPILPLEFEFMLFVPANSQWLVAALAAGAIVIAGVLYVTNTSIVRLYEGYPWGSGLIGVRRKTRYRNQLYGAQQGRAKASAIRSSLDAGKDAQLVDRLRLLQNQLARETFYDYPEPGSVLPTRLGNVIRSFENYPRRQYGIWAVTLFPRFIAKIPKEYAAVIDDAKTMFDVAIHFSFLSYVLAFLTITIGSIYPIQTATTELVARWITAIAIEMAIGTFCYVVAIGRAREWGDLIRSVFDLYRWEVLADLGFQQKPITPSEEQALWNAISRQLAYGDPLDKKRPTYLVPPTSSIVFTRGVDTLPSSQRLITLRIENRAEKTATNVQVAERLEVGDEYIWDSASVEGADALEVTGTNPYTFTVQRIPPSAVVLIKYRVLDRKNASK